ncbi:MULTISPECIES: hypothetical protein [unclassified Streptomyces]|nr:MULTISPECIES: hypothetical protein [unclassified Streptomyces]
MTPSRPGSSVADGTEVVGSLGIAAPMAAMPGATPPSRSAPARRA